MSNITKFLFLSLVFLLPNIAQAEYCREYQRTISIGGRLQNAYGTACLQPDGSWLAMDNHAPVPSNVIIEDRPVYVQEPVYVERPVYYNEPYGYSSSLSVNIGAGPYYGHDRRYGGWHDGYGGGHDGYRGGHGWR